MRRAFVVVVSLLACAACSDDDGGPDSGGGVDQAVASDGTIQRDGPGQVDGPAQSDGPAATDGPNNVDAATAWNCTLKPGGGSFSTPHSDGCKWEWSCPTEGDRQLYCETISTASHTCTCKNLTTGTVEKTFTSVSICTLGEQAIPAEANLQCGWNLPTS